MLPDVLENSGTGRTSTGSLATTSILIVSVTVSYVLAFVCGVVGFSEPSLLGMDGLSYHDNCWANSRSKL
jgi:hypothetical protein